MKKIIVIMTCTIIILYLTSFILHTSFINVPEPFNNVSSTKAQNYFINSNYDNFAFSKSDNMREITQKLLGNYNLTTDMNTTIKGINGWMAYYSLAIGDIDNDNRDDIIIGDFLKNCTGRAHSGVVYIIFGNDRSIINSKTNLSMADITIHGANKSDTIARWICSGDIDNDGFDDILIPADNDDKLYIIYGKPRTEFPNIIDLNESTSYSHSDIVIKCEGKPGQFSISIGDINGDNYDDIIMGSRDWNYYTGRVYIIYGNERDNFGQKKSLPKDADLIIIGPSRETSTGYRVFTSDINNDNKSEIFIGYISDYSGLVGIYGSENLPEIIELNFTKPNLNGDFILKFSQYDYASFEFASGDINGDNYNDLVFSDAPDGIFVVEDGVTYGDVYVVYGRDRLPSLINLSYTDDIPHADVLFKGNEDHDCFGRGLAVGDIDRNGKGDIISGASQAKGYNNLKKWSGETYLIYGRIKEKFNKINYISQIQDATFFGVNESDFSGETVVSGDIDGDGTDDIIISSA